MVNQLKKTFLRVITGAKLAQYRINLSTALFDWVFDGLKLQLAIG